MKVLVTGGLGYIGSHTVVELIASGHEPIIVDNLANSKQSVLNRLQKIVGKDIVFEKLDLTDKDSVEKLFTSYPFDAVIHFAGHKAVGESVAKPLEYYRNNIDSTLVLLEAMSKHNVKNIIFSSSATVYGNPSELPLEETSQTGIGITNPYGWTKYMLEQILTDLKASDDSYNVTLLRYFNPIGAHSSGLIGEDPSGLPNNLLPYVQQVAIGKLEKLKVFGNNYDTIDGTGVRDYIHVVDLAKGHVSALENIGNQNSVGIYNLGTGNGVSVLEVIKAFENASGKSVPYEVVDRRPGDIAACYADASKAKAELGWQAEKTLQDACKDAWRWQQNV
ncbi:UDP-glucose 4-epimerase GalE [Candidatus Saccharibacteria bacterium]|nr:UDP-glucose 4-epimerase GalE [Candidatus Saccharibacteria bacterium]